MMKFRMKQLFAPSLTVKPSAEDVLAGMVGEGDKWGVTFAQQKGYNGFRDAFVEKQRVS